MKQASERARASAAACMPNREREESHSIRFLEPSKINLDLLLIFCYFYDQGLLNVKNDADHQLARWCWSCCTITKAGPGETMQYYANLAHRFVLGREIRFQICAKVGSFYQAVFIDDERTTKRAYWRYALWKEVVQNRNSCLARLYQQQNLGSASSFFFLLVQLQQFNADDYRLTQLGSTRLDSACVTHTWVEFSTPLFSAARLRFCAFENLNWAGGLYGTFDCFCYSCSSVRRSSYWAK